MQDATLDIEAPSLELRGARRMSLSPLLYPKSMSTFFASAVFICGPSVVSSRHVQASSCILLPLTLRTWPIACADGGKLFCGTKERHHRKREVVSTSTGGALGCVLVVVVGRELVDKFAKGKTVLRRRAR